MVSGGREALSNQREKKWQESNIKLRAEVAAPSTKQTIMYWTYQGSSSVIMITMQLCKYATHL